MNQTEGDPITLLINATKQETRAAWINEKTRELHNLHIDDHNQNESTRGNIYLAKITRVEQALSAYFVSYLDDQANSRHGFLPWKDTHPNLKQGHILPTFSDEQLKSPENIEKSLNNKLEVGQQLLVQVARDERGNKGAALSTYISLPGSFLVLVPNNPAASGISKKAEGEDREKAKAFIKDLNFPAHFGVILRTAGLKSNLQDLQADLDRLLDVWASIQTAANEHKPPMLVFSGETGIKKLLRDSLGNTTQKVIVDCSDTFALVKDSIGHIRPNFSGAIEHYTSLVPIFTHYQVQQKLESIYAREVSLPSGGSIVIDRTEALVAIDVNSGKSTRSANIEETAINTNLEAANEIALQLRLRDIGGIIVIDFIDMSSDNHRLKVETQLNAALKHDPAKTHTYEISRLGLLEMSRQRVRPSVGDNNLEPCSHCNRRGYLRTASSFASSIMHLLSENAVHANHCILQIQLPADVANYLWNQNAILINEIEQKYGVEIIVIANPGFVIPKYQLRRIPKNTSSQPDTLSYTKGENVAQDLGNKHKTKYSNTSSSKPIVAPLSTDRKENIGLFTKIWQAMFKESLNTPKKASSSKKPAQRRRSNQRNQNRRRTNQQNKQRSPQNNQNPNNLKKDSQSKKPQRRRRPKAQSDENNTKSSKNLGKTANSKTAKNQEYL